MDCAPLCTHSARPQSTQGCSTYTGGTSRFVPGDFDVGFTVLPQFCMHDKQLGYLSAGVSCKGVAHAGEGEIARRTGFARSERRHCHCIATGFCLVNYFLENGDNC